MAAWQAQFGAAQQHPGLAARTVIRQQDAARAGDHLAFRIPADASSHDAAMPRSPVIAEQHFQR
jgi:hypothetical protein